MEITQSQKAKWKNCHICMINLPKKFKDSTNNPSLSKFTNGISKPFRKKNDNKWPIDI